MAVGSLEHILMFLVTAAFMAGSCFVVARVSRRWQNFLIALSVVTCCLFIFYRFAMGLSWEGGISLKGLLLQQLQVCNFNFILLPLTLVPRFKLARQYAFYFSMFAASTTLVALNSRWGALPWYSSTVLNSWIYHSCAIICPLWMFASRRLRPERKYILPVTGCVVAYFTLVYGLTELLWAKGILPYETSFSYVYDTEGIPILDTFHQWINVPYFHLYLSLPIAVLFFYLLSLPFNRFVAFDANGGEGKIRKRYGTAVGEILLPDGGFIREGYTLVGWSEEAGRVTQYRLGAKIPTGKKNRTLYAVWQKKET